MPLTRIKETKNNSDKEDKLYGTRCEKKTSINDRFLRTQWSGKDVEMNDGAEDGSGDKGRVLQETCTIPCSVTYRKARHLTYVTADRSVWIRTRVNPALPVQSMDKKKLSLFLSLHK